MGYYTRVTGEITFHPPIPWGTAKDDDYLKGWREGSTKAVRLRVEEQQVETNEGTLIRRSVTGIVPISAEPFKVYDIEDEVRELVARYCSPHVRTCSGHLEGEGEESGDLWRLYARGNDEVVRVVPTIVWPDESEDR